MVSQKSWVGPTDWTVTAMSEKEHEANLSFTEPNLFKIMLHSKPDSYLHG